jgi:putative transposase
MIRGIERRKIFINDRDRADMLERLARLLPQTETTCYAWVLIPNHAHFLFRTGLAPIASIMRRLLTGYAVSFNNRHSRHGQLFQNRYKSIVCREDSYLKELVRYIHLNPVRSGIVPELKELNRYPYCGHSALMGEIDRPWQDVAYVLGYFGGTAGQAKKSYLNFMEEGVAQGRREDLTGGGLVRSIGGWAEAKRLKRQGHGHVMSDERILGDSAFVEHLLSQANETYERRYELKRIGYDADWVAKRVADIYNLDPRDFLSKGRQQLKVRARSLFCFWAVRELGMSLRDLARRLSITPPAVGYAVERGEAIAREMGYKLIE